MQAQLSPDSAAPLTFEQIAALRAGDRVGCWFTATRRDGDGWIGEFTVTAVRDGLIWIDTPDGPDTLDPMVDDVIAWPATSADLRATRDELAASLDNLLAGYVPLRKRYSASLHDLFCEASRVELPPRVAGFVGNHRDAYTDLIARCATAGDVREMMFRRD